jgi:DNA replicative helicase MCM subunit Mcm2 (Cdc46/Mcm family)
VLSNEAAEDLVQGYMDMRKLGISKKTITATPRQLESLIRISEARAKMRFSNVVERTDVAEAIRLMKVALQQAAIDPQTGTIDMDLITTGRTANSRSRLADLARELRSLVHSSASFKMDDLHRTISQQSSMVNLHTLLALFFFLLVLTPAFFFFFSSFPFQEVSMSELKDALKMLEDEEFLTISGDYRNPTVRKL